MQKINVKIQKNGIESEVLLRLVGNVNAGKAGVSVRDLEGYFATRFSMFPMLDKTILVKDIEEPNTFHISEDGGKTFTLSMEWVEVTELIPAESN